MLAMKKRLEAVDINVDAFMDADDLGQRLVECVRQIDSNVNVVNLVKIHVGSGITKEMFPNMLEQSLMNPLRELGVTNCVFVPLIEGYIEDITIDHIEVVTE